MGVAPEYEDDQREFVEELIRFESTSGNEQPAQTWFRDRLEELGFETYTWEADAARLATLEPFPDADEIDAADRPSVGGVLEFGDPEAGPTLVLNGHVDVVPVDRPAWESDPFEPTWNGDSLAARGAADMKSQLAMLVFAARALHDEARTDLDGRIVVESVTGEEEGGIGAPMAALENPYPFDRDAALVAEPTEFEVVVATAGVFIAELEISGRSAHAASRWNGESVLPHFEAVCQAFRSLEAERHDRLDHPLYDYPVNCPVNVGTVDAGTWASSVPSRLLAEVRVGYLPDESAADVEAAFRERLEEVTADSEWLRAHPPRFERRGIHFEPSAIDPGEPIVETLRGTLRDAGRGETDPIGQTYCADSRFYIDAGIPSVVFGPGSIEQAHFPNEMIHWPDVLAGTELVAETARRYLESGGG
ncbi:M20 family metallopeptidase [Natrononativus amylolyticus]|uniref:M20 family metallopeptidase n=1 Tax=Natrononativus amylolyticus TaxID=2963434 RepID=UPI0020CC8328|nr:M20/M25/M40 family metallo-hydrolase [Natrononativus amylolyticus]